MIVLWFLERQFPPMSVQWNPSITDTIGNQQFVLYSEVSLTQGLLVGVVCVIELLSTTWLWFSELSFAVRWQGRG